MHLSFVTLAKRESMPLESAVYGSPLREDDGAAPFLRHSRVAGVHAFESAVYGPPLREEMTVSITKSSISKALTTQPHKPKAPAVQLLHSYPGKAENQKQQSELVSAVLCKHCIPMQAVAA
jgi:hypothetical protein